MTKAMHTQVYGALTHCEDRVVDEAEVYQLANETGTGRITVYQVMEGVELVYNDLHLAYCNQHQPTTKNVLEINHCRVGRFAASFGENSCCYVASGDLSISAQSKRKAHSDFPLRHYHGISVLVALDALTPATRALMTQLGIDLTGLKRRICDENRCVVLRADASIDHIFSELYEARAQRQPGYRVLKTLELLLFLSDFDVTKNVQHVDYLSRAQVALAKSVAEAITADLTQHYTIEALAARFDVSETALKKGFRGVFGTSVYAYLRQYRLAKAQQLLLESTLSVTEIAGIIGYENPNKFTSAFKKTYGITPTAFRKRAQTDRSEPFRGGEEV